MTLVGVGDAAAVLGVSSRRVRQMLAHGALAGQRVGRTWVVDRADLELFRPPGGCRVGRPWQPASAWALLAVASGRPHALSPTQRSRARRRLEAGLENFLERLAVRAEAVRYYAHPSVIGMLADAPGLVRSGVSAASYYQLDVVAVDEFEGYVRSSVLPDVVDRLALDEHAERPNVVLRVVEDEFWPFGSNEEVAPAPVVAVDLLEADDGRSRRAATQTPGASVSRWPVLDRTPVELPTLGIQENALWHALLELADLRPREWTLIGGQMVLVHATEAGVRPMRLSTDLDVLVNARVVTGGVRGFVRAIESRGFVLAGASPQGVAHRYHRDRVSIDVLAPEGLGPRTDVTTTPPGHTVQVPGGTQALNRTELLPVAAGPACGLLPRPSLLGALVIKAAAVSVDDVPEDQRSDLALLLSLIQHPTVLRDQLSSKDRKRLRARSAMLEPHHRAWSQLPTSQADRGRAALRLLLG